MKGYLLDTSTALFAVGTPEVLSPQIRRYIERGPAFLSVVTHWEVMIKSMKGSLDVGDPRRWFAETLDSLALQTLLLRPDHIVALHSLPPIHQDPFDRALIAQAKAEDLTLLTTDNTVSKYASDDFRVLR